ncbi:PAS domain-containing protein [Pedobacter fastidiosus]|uniref:PAS domain-containing protein n=1 Tax=Pedobacter fastidiosus TaxID=2765361 RepID=UPI00361D4D05
MGRNYRQIHDDLLAFGWADLVHEDDRERYVNIYLSALESRVDFTGEFRLLSKTGDYYWLLAKGSPRLRSDGTFLGYISSCIDITDRKLYELERQNLNSLIEASSEFIGLADLDGNFEYLNPAALSKLGWSDFAERMLIDCVYPEDKLKAETIF